MDTDPELAAERERLLLELTGLPTAAGREHRVIEFIERWVAERPALRLSRDAAGNIWIEPKSTGGAGVEPRGSGAEPGGTGVSPVRDLPPSRAVPGPVTPTPVISAPTTPGPIIFQAHLDHPAFVVTATDSPREATAEFRGGVQAPYFKDARIILHTRAGGRVPGVVAETTDPDEPAGRPYRVARLIFDDDDDAAAGDIATWDLPAPEIRDGLLHAPACDDLAAVAAALCAIEELAKQRHGSSAGPRTQISDKAPGWHGSPSRVVEFDYIKRRSSLSPSLSQGRGGQKELRGRPARAREKAARTQRPPDIRLLLTRAEEVGFIGTIAACRSGVIPAGARIIALENSRAFAESPVGAGPIVRVGDRLSVFSPTLTAAIAKIAQDLKTGGTVVTPSRFFRWQRKLMPGGACEASAFCAFGHEATCLCLPLGNYHNMSRLDEVEASLEAADAAAPAAAVAPEFVSVDDFHNLVSLLVACGNGLDPVEPMTARLEKLYNERARVLED